MPSLSLGSKRSTAKQNAPERGDDTPSLRPRKPTAWYCTPEARGGAVLVLLALGLPVLLYWLVYALKEPPPDTVGTCSLSDAYRVWCLPGDNVSRSACTSAGCCWDAGGCFHALPAEHGYRVAGWSSPAAALAAALGASGLRLTPRRSRTPFGSPSLPLRLFVRPRSTDSLAILLAPDGTTVPESDVPLSDCAVGVELEGAVLGFAVYRREDNSSLLLAVDTAIVYSDTYREVSLAVEDDVKFVAGAMLPRSSDSSRLLYPGPGRPMALPSVWLLDDSGRAAVLTLESLDGPVEAWHTYGSTVLTLRGMTPGSWTLLVTVGPTPAETIQKLHSSASASDTARSPLLPPIWALGLHLCPYAPDLQEALAWMESMQDFPWDSTCLWNSILGPTLGNSSAQPLHDIEHVLNSSLLTGRKVIISVSSAACFDCEVPEQSLVYSENGSQIYSGMYKGERVVYPDWSMEEARLWFRSAVLQQLQPLSDYRLLGGVVLRDNWPSDESEHSFEEVDYFPGGLALSTGSLWWQAKHSGGQLPHYQIHASLPVFQMQAVESDLPLVLSDAAVPGVMGSTLPYVLDNGNNETVMWSELHKSIEDVQMSGLGGVPFAAPPVCGGAAELPIDQELCLRWVQASMLMPILVINRDLLNATFGNSNTLADMENAIYVRYRLMPYLYSALAESLESGLPLIRPAWFHDPDVAVLKELGRSDQFWIGPAILSAPVVTPATYSVSVRLPQADFFHLFGAGKRIHGSGTAILIQSLEPEVLLLVREGYVLPMQVAQRTAEETRLTNLTLVAALRCDNNTQRNCSAEGKMRVQDSSLADPWLYFKVTTERIDNSDVIKLTITNLRGSQGSDCESDVPIIDTIRVLGIPQDKQHLFVQDGLSIERCSSADESVQHTFIVDLPV